ncbi:MAG: FAD-dependent oxidoreductase, partial [Vibrio sp.]
MKHYDIVIVGAGMAGASLAFALTRANGDLNIAVIEAKSTDGQEHPGFDSR